MIGSCAKTQRYKYFYSIQTQGIKIQRYKKSWIMLENTKKILQIQTVEQWLRKKWNVLTFGDVNRFWSSSRKLKSSRQIDAERPLRPRFWDKWCKILHSRPLLALNFIIETSFFCNIFLIFSAIVQDKRPFFTTFDYIVAVIQALQFVDYKDVLRFCFFNAI
jgi:hypothetical protein